MQPTNELLSTPSRLSILAFLSTAEEVDFTSLSQATGMTSGNLSTHLTKLEGKKLVHIEKKFVNKRPRTTVRITKTGRDEFLNYVKEMENYYRNMAEQTLKQSAN